MQLLALELVNSALIDAGYREHNPLKQRTSVVMGVGGGLADLGSQYVFRALLPQYVDDPQSTINQHLPTWTEDSFAGILLNVVAGRVANRFDLGGLNLTVDAACASSLAAMYVACNELASGAADMVISGGCDTLQNPMGFSCFDSAGALSPRGKCRPFDATADGIAISEGLAAVVLKRRKDAERDGDRIYALIRAVASGSDGRTKCLTAPGPEGQLQTLQRAYRQAGVNPASVKLIEAHGTGTPRGDVVEGASLKKLLLDNGSRSRSCAIGSVKSNIGHTKCAAGLAGLIKAALSLFHSVLPPSLHVERRILRLFPRMAQCTSTRNYGHGLSLLRRDELEFRHSASEEPTFISYWKSTLPTPPYVHDCFLGAHLLPNCSCLARDRLPSCYRSLSKRAI